jgi:hypothetical protein
MRAMVFDRYGEPAVMRLRDVPVPQPQDREVLIRVDHAGVNPADSKARAGHRYREVDFPFVTNSELHAQLEVLTSEGAATSAIEGERFDPNALRSSLARRLGLPTAGLPAPPRSIEGLADVLLDATQKLDKPLTLRMLAGWQAAFFPTGRSGLSKIEEPNAFSR